MEANKKEKSCVFLPEDSMFELLLRLPVKSLLRFRSVSKQWLRLIDGPVRKDYDMPLYATCRSPFWVMGDIVVTKKNNRVNKRALALRIFDVSAGRMHYNMMFDCFGIRDYYVCGGLALFVDKRYKRVFAFNPGTRELACLPRCPIPIWTISFGFLSSRNEYKIINMFRSSEIEDEATSAQCSILTLTDGGDLGSSSWRLIKYPRMPWEEFLIGSPVCVNGAVYQLFLTGLKLSLHAFDLETETSVTTPPLPRDYESIIPDKFHLVELRGSLCVVESCSLGSVICECTHRLWVLKYEEEGDGEVDKRRKYSWLPQYRIHVVDFIPIPTSNIEGDEFSVIDCTDDLRAHVSRYKIMGRECVLKESTQLNRLWPKGIPFVFLESFFCLNGTSKKIAPHKRKRLSGRLVIY